MSDSPYTPPKSVVQDALGTSRLERRTLGNLYRLVDDEPARLALMRRLAWVFLVVGAGAAALAAWWAPATTTSLVILAALGGYMLGTCNYMFASLRAWPVTRRYLDADRVRTDYKSMG
jgi:hypothetical protein